MTAASTRTITPPSHIWLEFGDRSSHAIQKGRTLLESIQNIVHAQHMVSKYNATGCLSMLAPRHPSLLHTYRSDYRA